MGNLSSRDKKKRKRVAQRASEERTRERGLCRVGGFFKRDSFQIGIVRAVRNDEKFLPVERRMSRTRDRFNGLTYRDTKLGTIVSIEKVSVPISDQATSP